VALGTTVFSFKTSVPFKKGGEAYVSEENKQLMKEKNCLSL